MMQKPINLKYFAYGALVAAAGAILADVGRDFYRKLKAAKWCSHLAGALDPYPT